MLLKSRTFLGSLLGKKIVQVKRQLFANDYAFYDPEIRDQESDGPTEFRTADGVVFHVVSNTEQMAIEVMLGPAPRFGECFVSRDVTPNVFWSSRTNKSIAGVDALQSLYSPDESQFAFGLEVFFTDAESFVIEYLSDEEHQDQLRITGPYAGPPCRRVPLEPEGTTRAVALQPLSRP